MTTAVRTTTAPKRAAADVTIAPPGKSFRVAIWETLDGGVAQPGECLPRNSAQEAADATGRGAGDLRIVLRPTGWQG